MGLFDSFKSALPEVPVDQATADAVTARMDGASTPDAAADALKALVEEDLATLAQDFLIELGVPSEEMYMELYLLAWTGFVHAHEDEGVAREDAVDAVLPFSAALREYVAFGHRERYDEGPAPILAVADRLAVGGRDPRHVLLGFLSGRLGVRKRKGAVEGLMRLAVLAQRGGYEVGLQCC